MRGRPIVAALTILAAAAAPLPAVAAPAAPPITLTLVGSGEKLDSRALLGKKVLVLRFQASWCKVCVDEAPGIQSLYERYRDRGVEVVAVHVQDGADDTRRFLEAHHATYPAGLDPHLRAAQRFGFKRTPYTVVIDRKGEMVARLNGPAGEAQLSGILDTLLKPRPPRKPPPRRLQ